MGPFSAAKCLDPPEAVSSSEQMQSLDPGSNIQIDHKNDFNGPVFTRGSSLEDPAVDLAVDKRRYYGKKRSSSLSFPVTFALRRRFGPDSLDETGMQLLRKNQRRSSYGCDSFGGIGDVDGFGEKSSAVDSLVDASVYGDVADE